MQKLLSATERRRLSIIEELVKKRTWVSVEDLALAARCSTKTIMTDYCLFADSWMSYFTIELSKNNMARIHFVKNKRMDDIYAEFLKQSPIFNFMEELFFTPRETEEYWADKLFISESSLYRMAKLINEEMENEVGVKLERQPLYFIGKKERWVRNWFTQYFETVTNLYNWPFPKIDQSIILNLVIDISKRLGFHLNDEEIHHYSLAAGVCLTRAKQNFLTDEMVQEHEKEMENLLLEYQNRVQAAVDFPLPSVWQVGILRTVFHFVSGWDNQEEKEKIHDEINEFMTSLSHRARIPINECDKFNLTEKIATLYSQYKLFPYAKYALFNNLKFQSERVFEIYPNFSHFLFIELKLLEKRTKFPWYSKMLSHVSNFLFSEWGDLPILLENKRVKIKILVISSLGLTHAKMVASILNIRFQYSVNVALYEGTAFDFQSVGNEKSEYQMIVANARIQLKEEEKLFVVDNVPSYLQLAEIAEEIARLQLEYHLMIKSTYK